MFYLANEGSTITQGETIAVIKKLRWKGMVYGDDTFNKLPRISEYDSYIINRNIYNNNRVPFVNAFGKLQTSDTTNVELGYLSGATSNIQTQPNAASVIKSDAGAYNSDTASDTWNEICKVGNLSIEVRYPDTENSVARIVNNTGSSVGIIYETNDEGTLVNNASNTSNGNGLVINPSSTAASGIKSFRAGIYTSPGVNTEAYTVEIYMRNVSGGIRISGSIVGKF